MCLERLMFGSSEQISLMGVSMPSLHIGSTDSKILTYVGIPTYAGQNDQEGMKDKLLSGVEPSGKEGTAVAVRGELRGLEPPHTLKL